MLLFLLLLAGWLCVRVGTPVPTAPAAPAEVSWRRTAAGWENSGEWSPEPFERTEPLHPGIVASFCLLASLFALTAFAAPANPPRIAPSE